jgi:hypothetical protein
MHVNTLISTYVTKFTNKDVNTSILGSNNRLLSNQSKCEQTFKTQHEFRASLMLSKVHMLLGWMDHIVNQR